MSRPLYLGSGAQSVCLDGPALRVTRDGQADMRVPLRLLSRVVARPNAEWTTAALLRSLEMGVPIVFLRPDGTPIGTCLPAAPRTLDLDQRLVRLEQEPGGRTAFENWAAAEERRAILAQFGRPYPHRSADLRPESLRAVVLGEADANPMRATAMLKQLEGMLAAHLSALLAEAGLSRYRSAPAPDGRLDLFSACMRAARWQLVPALELACRHRRSHPDHWRHSRQRHLRLVRRYEAVAPAVAAAMRRRLRRLDDWLWERDQ